MTSKLIDPRKLHPMPNQPRSSLGDLTGLEETFEKKGFKGSIIIWYPKPDYAEIISGHRSHQAFLNIAAKHNYQPPWDLIPYFAFENITEAKAYELAVLYNEQRQDLTLLELAISWSRLINQYKYTPKQVAQAFQTSVSTVYNTISILKEPDYIQKGISTGKLTLQDVLQLRRLPEGPDKYEIAMRAIEGKFAKSQIAIAVQTRLRRKIVKAVVPHDIYEVVVECADESQQEEIYNKLTGDGYKCRLLTL